MATISWTTTANGGAGITSYVVTASPGGESCATNGELTCVVRGLANGTSYTFSLVAINDMGASATSPASGAVAPSATWVVGPFALSTLAGYKSVTVSWGAATLSSGEAVGYVLRAVDGRVVCTTTAVSCKVRELVNGRTSQFSIEATSITTSAPVVATRKVVVGGLVQKANSMKRRSTALLSKVASTFSKGNVTWVVVKGKCRISGKYIYAPSTKGTCVLRVSVAKKAPFPAQKMTINLRVI